MTRKQMVFVDEYMKDFNGTQAAIRAGYSPKTARSIASENLTKPDIAEEISARIAERAMGANEVLLRLADIARGDMGNFMDIESMSYRINLEKAQQDGNTKLIKKIKDRTVMTSNKDGEETETHSIELELYDAPAALVALGRYHKLFTDNVDVTSGGKRIVVTLTDE